MSASQSRRELTRSAERTEEMNLSQQCGWISCVHGKWRVAAGFGHLARAIGRQLVPIARARRGRGSPVEPPRRPCELSMRCADCSCSAAQGMATPRHSLHHCWHEHHQSHEWRQSQAHRQERATPGNGDDELLLPGVLALRERSRWNGTRRGSPWLPQFAHQLIEHLKGHDEEGRKRVVPRTREESAAGHEKLMREGRGRPGSRS